jgi:DNA-binding MarR family transcriptional regulator
MITREQLLQRVLSDMRALSTDVDRVDEAAAEYFGTTRSDARGMDVLARAGAMSVGSLAKAVGLTYPAVSALIDRMERAGYVERIHDAKDRRRVIVAPTQMAAERAEKIFAGLVQDFRKLLDGYSDDDLRLLVSYLECSRSILARHAEEIRHAKRASPRS